jgi:5'-nucleotidase
MSRAGSSPLPFQEEYPVNSMPSRLAGVATALLIGAPLIATTPAHADDKVTLNLIGINDFHGRIDANTVKFAGTVEQVRRSGGAANSLLISAGDNVGASLPASAVQGDIPTINVLNALDLDASAVGNHEFDRGAADLTGRLAKAANFPFLAANVFKADGSPLLDKYTRFKIHGVDVAVIGAVTDTTPSLVPPAGIAGLTFKDPTDSINETVHQLKALTDPPDVIVASIHEGAWYGAGTLEQNVAATPAFRKIVEETDPAVDAIFMGHTHQTYSYDAPIPGEPGKTRPVLQTGEYGDNVGSIKLTFDRGTGTVSSYTRAIIPRTTSADAALVSKFPRVAEVKRIVDSAIAYANTPKASVRAAAPSIRQGSWTDVVARVAATSGRPTGEVTVSDGDRVLGRAWLWLGDTITIPTDGRSLSVGAHRLTVTYDGDEVYGPATTKVDVTVVERALR